MFHIYSFHFGIIIFVFLKKVFLKLLQNSPGNTCTRVSFLSAASNFINEETPAQCFPKPLSIFAISSIVDFQLGYKYARILFFYRTPPVTASAFIRSTMLCELN